MAQKSHHYNTYSFLSEKLFRIARKTANKALRPSLTMDSAIGKMINNNEEIMTKVIDGVILAEESNWMHGTDRHVIFPKDVEVLDRLRQAKFDLTDAVLHMPFDCFTLAFPKGYKLAGRVATGALISCIKPDERAENIIFPFLRKVGVEGMEYRKEGGDTGLYINYASNEMHDGFFGVVRACIPMSLLPALLESKSPQEYAEKLTSLNSSKAGELHQMELTDGDNAYQYELVKLIAAIAVYTQAMGKEALIDGFPAANRKNMEGSIIPKFKDSTLDIAASARRSSTPHDAHQSHYRSWHFRTLISERFYKGAFSHMERGSRIVFVKDSYVGLGQEIDPKTLVSA